MTETMLKNNLFEVVKIEKNLIGISFDIYMFVILWV